MHQFAGGKAMMGFWYHFAIMFEALFILSAVDADRVSRFQLGDAIGNIFPKFRDPIKAGSWLTTGVVVAAWGSVAVMGRDRSARWNPDALPALWHREPAHRHDGTAAMYGGGGKEGLHEAHVDTGYTVRVDAYRDLRGFVAEDLLAGSGAGVLEAVERRSCVAERVGGFRWRRRGDCHPECGYP